MRRAVDLLCRTGLIVSLIGAVAQVVLMTLDLFLPAQLTWYWGGAIAFLAAPVAFALTLRLNEGLPLRSSVDA